MKTSSTLSVNEDLSLVPLGVNLGRRGDGRYHCFSLLPLMGEGEACKDKIDSWSRGLVRRRSRRRRLMSQNENTLMRKMIERGIARQRMSLPPTEEMKELLLSKDLLG